LTQDDLLRCEELLNATPSKEIAQRYQQHPERARILLAGALIIHEGMKRLGLDEIRVSPHGLREGVLLARERYGDNWLDQINTIASQTESGKSSDNQQASSPEQGKSSDNQNHQDAAQAHPPDKSGEPFAQFGRDTLPKQTKKFLKWPKDILKHQDTEPVHKMRVASRHVRATLDAYESLVKPKRFKSVNRRVKKLADRLGTVRDTDVMIQGLQEQLKQVPSEEQPGIQWLIDRLHTYHQQQQKVLDTSLQKLKKKALKQQIQSSIPKGI
jgi:hypothetical protein